MYFIDRSNLLSFSYPPILYYDCSPHCLVDVAIFKTSPRSLKLESGCSSYGRYCCVVSSRFRGWIIGPGCKISGHCCFLGPPIKLWRFPQVCSFVDYLGPPNKFSISPVAFGASVSVLHGNLWKLK
jgi:hypothetical protein